METHRKMTAQITAYADRFSETRKRFVIELYDMMSRWLMQHILREDKKYHEHMVNALGRRPVA